MRNILLFRSILARDLNVLVVDCSYCRTDWVSLFQLHPQAQPSERAHWHRRPDMQIYFPHWCFIKTLRKHKWSRCSVIVWWFHCNNVNMNRYFTSRHSLLNWMNLLWPQNLVWWKYTFLTYIHPWQIIQAYWWLVWYGHSSSYCGSLIN